MPGRFGREAPRLTNVAWDDKTKRALQEFLDGLQHANSILQGTPGTPTEVGTVSDAGVGPAPALDDHSHRFGILTAKGDLLTFDGTDPVALPAGSDGQLLSLASGALTWQKWMWQDLREPATSIRLGAGGADSDTGNLIFRHGQDDEVFANFQMPHGFKRDTVYPHIHWYKTTSAAGTVNWEARWVIADVGGAFDDISGVSYTTLTEEISDGDTARLHAVYGTSIDLSSYSDSCMIILALRRQSSGGGDTYAADVHLLEIDIHHQVSNLGSLTEGLD
jgi:hypothetical protein